MWIFVQNMIFNNQVIINGKTTAYVCENFLCGEPITELEILKATVNNLRIENSPV